MGSRALGITFDGPWAVLTQGPGMAGVTRHRNSSLGHLARLHTELVLKGIAATDTVLAWANRLLKHWSCHHDRPLCSWHIKVLTLEAITEPPPIIDALEAFFQHAHAALGEGDTPDPAHVGPDIKARVSRAHARTKLEDGLKEVRAAKQAEADERPLRAQAHLASLLPDIVNHPDAEALADEDGAFELNRLRRTGAGTGVGVGAAVAVPRATKGAGGTGWLDVTGDVVVSFLANVVPVLLGIATYARQQKANHRDRHRDLFSEALQAVADYQELPYLVRRRSDHSPMTPADITRHASEVQSRLDFYVARIRLESATVADAFDNLVTTTRQEAGAQMTSAWAEPRITSDADMPLGTAYVRDRAEAAKGACIEAMQAYLDR